MSNTRKITSTTIPTEIPTEILDGTVIDDSGNDVGPAPLWKRALLTTKKTLVDPKFWVGATIGAAIVAATTFLTSDTELEADEEYEEIEYDIDTDPYTL